VCLNCVSNADLVVVNGIAAAAVARTGWAHVRGFVGSGARPSRAQRRTVTYDDDAAFIASLGLDPGEVLGPPPEAHVLSG
jgi:hypothetical protein